MVYPTRTICVITDCLNFYDVIGRLLIFNTKKKN